MTTPGGDGARIVIVTGSRKWAWRKVIERQLGILAPTLIVHGACPTGADAIAEHWAKDFAVPYHGIPAVWQPEGRFDKAAGMKRNRRMLLSASDAALARHEQLLGRRRRARSSRLGV